MVNDLTLDCMIVTLFMVGSWNKQRTIRATTRSPLMTKNVNSEKKKTEELIPMERHVEHGECGVRQK